MRTLIAAAVAMLAAFAAAPVAAQSYLPDGYRGDVVRCESVDGRTRECPASGGRMVLERQLSRSPCIEGRTWGQGRRGVWVSDGCRADFRVFGYAGGHGGGYDGGYGGIGQTVRCESNDGRYRRCNLPDRGRAQLLRQLSRSPCIEGRSWGSDRGSVWVTDGCRGDFAAARGGHGGGWGNSDYGDRGRTFRCESIDGRYIECAANTRAGVQLLRQLSNAACIEGRTWGYGNRGIWVAQGCRAEFRSF